MSETNDTPQESPWSDVSWEDLETWAGSRSLHRGRNYHKNGHVLELACSPEGELSGRVAGTEVYATTVSRYATGTLRSRCSCPVGANCKHAVAVVLEYLERLKAGDEVPAMLQHRVAEEAAPEAEADEYLAGLSAADLLALVHELAECSDQARTFLDNRARLASGEVGMIVAAARKEIQSAASRPGWGNYWSDEGYTPDYGMVGTHLESLLSLGHADEVLELGEEILRAGTQQVGMSDDEGETAMAIVDALQPAWEALSHSSLSPAERLVWLYDRYEEDEYELCEGSDEADVWEVEPEVWSEVADVLLARLRPAEPPPDGEKYAWNWAYDRRSETDRVINSLWNAERTEEALALAVSEARVTDSYERAVDLLTEAGQLAKARSLAQEGLKAKSTTHLRERLRELTVGEADHALDAAFIAEEFLLGPSLEAYCRLREASERAEAWDEVRAGALAYLRSGKLPFERKGWPLPETGAWPADVQPFAHAPDLRLMTRIALEEGDHDEALKWFGKVTENQLAFGGSELTQQLAREVAATHPDESIAIWRELAEREIAHVNRAAYEASLRYLRPMRRVLIEAGRQDEWDAYLAELREENSNRPALLETLDSLTDGPIIDP